MHITTACASLALLLPLVSAHAAIPGLPRVWGRSIEELDAKIPLYPRAARPESRPHQGPQLRKIQKRQNTEDQCGPGFGACADGYCCSDGGWCGKGNDYCGAPDCQLDYGTGCDAFKIPSGSTTSGIPRTQSNPAVRYAGGGIYHCSTPGTVALTYDDGPYNYTHNILKLLDQYNAKATFFITGNNLGKGEIDNPAYPWAAIIKQMHRSGHQIASHTWSHQDLSKISAQQMQNQIYYNEMALRNILGFFPQYMRPPYSSCNAACTAFLKRAGYHIIYFDLDTEDYLHPDAIQISKDYVAGNLSLSVKPVRKDWLVIGHDIIQQEAFSLTEYMLQQFQKKGFRMVTVGECLGDPSANWYRWTNGTTPARATSPPAATEPEPSQPTGPLMNISQDAKCGPAVGTTCQDSSFGNCCSQNGWCGAVALYCGAGCLPGYGSCGANATRPSPAAGATPSGPVGPSVDASCGGVNGYTCVGSGFGDCCSHAGWCGSKEPWCGAGCNPLFGICPSANGTVASAGTVPSSVAPLPTTTSVPRAKPTLILSKNPSRSSSTKKTTPTASSPPPWSTLPTSSNGTCGFGFACRGSTPCCIQVYKTPPGNCVVESLCKGLSAYCKPEFGKCFY